jgi:hypothetical protein
MSPLEKAGAAMQAARLVGSGLTQLVMSMPTRIRSGDQAADDYIAENIYQPTIPKATEYVGDFGEMMEQLETKYKLPPIMPELLPFQEMAGLATRQAAKTGAKVGKAAGMNALQAINDAMVYQTGPLSQGPLSMLAPKGAVSHVFEPNPNWKTNTVNFGKPTPGIMIPSKMSNVREAVRDLKGNYGARRVERAADEIPNLERMYQEDALKEAFTGDNANAMITLSPAEFERYALELKGRTKRDIGPKMAELARQGDIDKYTVPMDEYIKHLQRLQGGFNDVPYLNLFKDEVGLPTMSKVTGHEGRHRSRALAEQGAPTSLVQINPRGDLREGLPRRTQEEFIEALKEELERSNRLVLPESDGPYQRPAIEFPEPYAEGGSVNMAAGGLFKGIKAARKGAPNAERSMPARGALRFADEPAGGPSVIKEKGGNWMSGSAEKAVGPLLQKGMINNREIPYGPEFDVAIRQRIEDLKQSASQPGYQGGAGRVAEHLERNLENPRVNEAAINKWVQSNLTNYIKKEMATPEDPVRRLAEEGIVHIPSEQVGTNRYKAPDRRATMGGEQLGQSDAAKAWEDASDVALRASRIRDLSGDYKEPWMANADPSTKIYSPGREMDALGFDHIVDVLREDLAAGRIRPEQLSKVSMEQAVRRTYEYNQEKARKMAEAQIKITEGMPVHKEYPEGYKWVELAQPKELPAGWSPSASVGHYYDEAGNFQRHPGEKILEDALKYEGDTMGHCVGGYCPDVLEGRKRIYSLRDAKGEPHVTIEVQPMRGSELGRYAADLPEGEDVATMKNPPLKIVQIKGKGNRAPKEEYLPFVQDFVRGGKWSDVGDLQNTGLHKLESEYLTLPEAEARYKPKVQEALSFLDTHPILEEHRIADKAYQNFSGNIPSPEYEQMQRGAGRPISENVPYTIRELRALLSAPEDWVDRNETIYRPISTALEKINQAKKELGIADLPPENMKRGGSVHISDNPDTMMMELGDQHFVLGGLSKANKAVAKAAKPNLVIKSKPGIIVSDLIDEEPDIAKRLGAEARAKRQAAIEAEGQRKQLAAQTQPSVGYRPSTPQKPDPLVGTRFVNEQAFGLNPNEPFDISKFKGGSGLVLPWDSQSRNVKTTQVSGMDLPNQIFDVTHGGIPYAFDTAHVNKGVAGASGLDIAKRVKTRADTAVKESIGRGDTGELLHFPITMGFRAEDYALPYSEFSFDIINHKLMTGELTQKEVDELTKMVRNFEPPKYKGKKPFENFAGFTSPEGLDQIYTGQGLKVPSGELRKAIADRIIWQKGSQEKLGFNAEDLMNATTYEPLRGVDKGYIGSTVMRNSPGGMRLSPSTGKYPYDTDFSGEHLGRLDDLVDAEALFYRTLNPIKRELITRENLKPYNKESLRNAAIGAIEKRNEAVSQPIDQQFLDDYANYLNELKKPHEYRKGGAITVKPKRDGQKFKPGKKPDVLITKKPEDMVMGGNQSQISTEAFMSAGGKLSKVALEAIQRMKAMRPEIAAKSSLEQKALAENTAKYARDIQPFSMTDEEVAAEMKRLESKGMAGGGEVNADDLILEERPL